MRPNIDNPVGGNPEAISRGQNYFNQFNCVGCHAPNGAGVERPHAKPAAARLARALVEVDVINDKVLEPLVRLVRSRIEEAQ